MSDDGQHYNIPVNKGQSELEPPERLQEFQMKMGAGWEYEYNEYRKLWDNLPQQRKIRNYPMLVDLELADVCNLQCPMCVTRTDSFIQKRRKGFMDTALARKIIDEIAGKVFALRVSWIGESTLHPDFIDILNYAKNRGIKEIAFLTNGSTLNIDFFEKIVYAGATWITISVDGLGEEYNAIRKPLRFEDTLKKLQKIKNFKDKNKLIKPVIKIQGVWPAIRKNPSEYYNTLAPLVDLVAYNPLIDYLHKDYEIVYEENFVCPQLYQRVVIASDGRASMCSSDDYVDLPVGNANEQSIYEIWHGETLNKMRKTHLQKDGFLKLEPCRICFYPRKTEVDETAIVNGRTIYIENYINRKQKIGE
jgi:MoaA/NifB/PqqE/SkfB family radical SAM enzyme